MVTGGEVVSKLYIGWFISWAKSVLLKEKKIRNPLISFTGTGIIFKYEWKSEREGMHIWTAV